ncbi:MAG TPA: hypothetical protein VMX75_13490, partial [Spirochaetia bacterium]|nr:hypothetical protein [Spirochaetia bacterium]
DVLGGYLQSFVRDDSLIIILGDHQPFAGITGRNKCWSVPIHVISRNRTLLEPFVRRGYTWGMVPRQDPPHPGMERFLPGLLEDFSTSPISGSADPE